MDSRDVSFEETFARRLPLELRQMVFKWAVMGNSNDIEINSDRDKIVSPEPSALEFLAKLKESYPYHVYHEAILYLTKPMFRWVFTSDSEPHHHLLKTFHKQAPPELRERIYHVYLRRIRLASLVNSMKFPTGRQDRWTLKLPRPSHRSEYLQRIVNEVSGMLSSVLQEIILDILGSMFTLPQALPFIHKLDIDLDFYDCTLLNCIRPSAAFVRDLTLEFNAKFTILFCLLPLDLLKDKSELEIRVFWGDYFRQDNNIHGRKEKEARERMQESFMKSFREVVSAKCITSHEKAKMPMHPRSEC